MCPNFCHQCNIKLNIVITDKPASQYFSCIEEMAKIRARKIAARVAPTVFIERRLILCIPTRFYHHFSFGCECHAGSSISCRQHTVKEINTQTDCLHNILRVAAPHEISHFFFWKYRVNFVYYFTHDRWRLTNHQTTDSITRKIEIYDTLGAFLA